MRAYCLPIALLLFIPRFVSAETVIDFESVADSDLITNQIAGLTFVNTVVLTAGISLNEFDFPPHSGVNVVSDNGGPISIEFGTPVLGFAAYFTYLQPLTLAAFNASNIQVATALSLFGNNTGTAGDPGSSPNELLQVSSPGFIDSVSITGDPAGGSFVMDDVTLTAVVPEPRTLWLILAAIGVIGLLSRRRSFS